MFVSVTRHVKRATGLISSAEQVAETAASVLDPRLEAYLRDGESLEGLRMVQVSFVRWIADDLQHLEVLEDSHREALQELTKVREVRDRELQVLYGKLLGIRKTFEDAFGIGTAPTYLGLDPGLADVDPEALRRYARGAHRRLTNPDFSAPPPKVDGVWENPLVYASQIQTCLEPFEAALSVVKAHTRVVESAQRERTEHLDRARDRVTWGIRFFEAVYRLAGLGFHADRLRTPVGSRSGEVDPGPVEESSDEEPQGSESGDEPAPVTEGTDSSASSASDTT